MSNNSLVSEPIQPQETISPGLVDLTCPGDEAGVLSQEMLRQRKYLIEYFRQKGYSLVDAQTRAIIEQDRLGSSNGPVEDWKWEVITGLLDKDQQAGVAKWKDLKDKALNELQSGHRAASAMEYISKPWKRAQFLAVRKSMIQEWNPSRGIELQLIDMMAQAYTAQLYWMNRMARRWGKEDYFEKGHNPDTMRLYALKELEFASEMVDRFNKMYMRALRALRDLRKYLPEIHINQFGQNNTAQVQIGNTNQIVSESGVADKHLLELVNDVPGYLAKEGDDEGLPI